MKRNNLWWWLFLAFVVFWSAWEINPPKGRNLIDVFEERSVGADTNFTAIVKTARDFEKQLPERNFQNLYQAIGTNQVARYFPYVDVAAADDANRAVLNYLQREAAGKVKLGLDLQGGTSFLVEMDVSKLNTDTNRVVDTDHRARALSQAVEVLRKRVDKFGVSEPVIQPAGDNRILIQMPGLSEADKLSARSQIERAAFLEFRLVHPESDQLVTSGIIEPGYEVLFQRAKGQDGRATRIPYLVKKKSEQGLTGKYVTSAMVAPNPMTGQPQIHLTFNGEGAALFADITTRNVQQRLAIVLDGEVYSAPNINEPIPSGRAEISGSYDLAEAMELANVLENPLEAPVKIISERGVDPSLGKDSVASGVRSAIIGTIAVSGFMLVYYLMAGAVANVALCLNILILMGVMCSIGTTLTMPGIAGIVLTIGMAVDANVLIFERIREELAAGKSLRGSLSAGYDKAFSTIFDSNVTTLISSVILIYLGTGPVKGFGVTLTIGVVVSMFTALVVTRLFFDFLLSRNLLNLKMFSLVKQTKFDFLSWAKPAFAISWALVIIGVGYGVSRGKDVLGVDFAGGDSLIMKFEQKVEVDKVREALATLKISEPLIQYQRDITAGTETLNIVSTYDTGDEVEQALQQEFAAAKFQRIALDKVGPTVGAEIMRSAIVASLLALFGILVYVALRYEFSFALGAVVAVIHDVLMTMGWFCLTGREFSAPMVAAILTIIGFSINDTIVIFDRIREDLKLGVRGTFKEVMNAALNKTLSRTIITAGTVFIATLSLYLFGGGVINDFAFTFLVGILTGTYSSIYIAGTVVLWWHKGERPKLASQVTMDNSVTARV